MTIERFAALPFPRYPINNVTPFTYRDGHTFLEIIEELRERFTVIVESSIQQSEAFDKLVVDLNDTIAELLSQLIGYTIEVGTDTYSASMMDGSEFSAYTVEGVDNLLTILESSLSNMITNEVSDLDNQIKARNSHVHNVIDYGAVGDGETVDTVAIQSAIDACGKGETVLFPSNKKFRVQATLNVANHGVNLTGNGEFSFVQSDGMMNKALFNVTGDDANFDGIHINGNNFLSKGIQSTGQRTRVANSVIEWLRATAESAKGVFINSRYGCEIVNNTIRNIESVGNGIPQDNDGASRAIEVRMDSPGALAQSIIANNTLLNVSGEEGDTIQISVTGGGTKFPNALVTIENNVIDGFNKRAIKIQGSRCIIRNNKISSTLPVNVSGTYHAMDILFSDDIEIVGNEIRGDLFNGVWLNGNPENYSYNNIVRDNVIINGQDKTAIYVFNNPRAEIDRNLIHDGAFGVRVVNSNYATVTNNQFVTPANIARQQSPIHIHENSWRVTVTGNVFRGEQASNIPVITSLGQEATVTENQDYTNPVEGTFLYTGSTSERTYFAHNVSNKTTFHADKNGWFSHLRKGPNHGKTGGPGIVYMPANPQTNSSMRFERGTVCFNVGSNLEVVGWICTESGSPGTWASFGV